MAWIYWCYAPRWCRNRCGMIPEPRSWKNDGHRPDRFVADRSPAAGVLGAVFSFIILFNQRVAASPAELSQVSLAGLEHDLPIDKWLRLAFHALPDGSVAFRESFEPSFQGRYFGLMRGLIVVDTRRREVRVVGRCSWFALILTLLVVPIMLVRPMAWPMLACPLIFYVGYRIQRRRYANVVEAVRARLRSEFPRRFVDQ